MELGGVGRDRTGGRVVLAGKKIFHARATVGTQGAEAETAN